MKKHDSNIGVDKNVDEQLTEDEANILDELGIFGDSRRKFLGQMSTAGGAILAAQMLGEQQIFASSPAASEVSAQTIENGIKVVMKINGAEKSLNVDSRMTLLDALRERLELTGSKKGCDHGQCGACTVIVEGRRVLSCLTLTATCEGKSITTIG